jgi:hypothetical protein
MNWDAMKRVVMMAGDTPVGYFDCIGDAARMAEISTTSMTGRIKSQYVKNGVSFRFAKEGEDLDGVPCLSPKRERPEISVKKKDFKPKEASKKLDGEKYTILKYEVRNIRECITPCPFKEAPKPMVGSAKCMSCGSYRGRNRIAHEIACNHQRN